MKKLFLTFALISGAVFISHGQEIAENTIGLRLGGGNGFGVEISYQRAIGGENNRLEFDLGLEDNDQYSAMQVVGLYHWVWNIEGGFNWYAGPGVGLGFYSFEDEAFPGDNEPGGTYGFIAGNIGVEYGFDFPLLLSLDFRPEFVIDDFEDGDDLDFGIGLGVRYQF